MKKTLRPNNRALFSVWVWLDYPHTTKDYEKENLLFLKEHKISESRFIYVSSFSPTVIIRASESEIENMQKSPFCIEITPYKEQLPLKATDEIILTQLRADSALGTTSSFFNSGEGYRGQGVVFGMISAERKIFSSLSPQLQKALLEDRIKVLDYPLPVMTSAAQPSAAMPRLRPGLAKKGFRFPSRNLRKMMVKSTIKGTKQSTIRVS